MLRYHQSGQANLTAILSLLGLVVSGVWVWKRLSPDMQDLIIDQALPLAALLLVLLTSVWILVKKNQSAEQSAEEVSPLDGAIGEADLTSETVGSGLCDDRTE